MFKRCFLALTLVCCAIQCSYAGNSQPCGNTGEGYTNFNKISVSTSFTSVNSSRTNLLSFFMDAQECADLGDPITLQYDSGGENSLTRRCLVFDPARMAALWLPGTTVNVHFGHRYNEAEPNCCCCSVKIPSDVTVTGASLKIWAERNGFIDVTLHPFKCDIWLSTRSIQNPLGKNDNFQYSYIAKEANVDGSPSATEILRFLLLGGAAVICMICFIVWYNHRYGLCHVKQKGYSPVA